jgi:ABC-type Fe3+-hydroxamate transport system substrate-binding protein
MNRYISSFVLTLSLAFLAGCACRPSSGLSSKQAVAPEFERLYSAWHQECEKIRYSSNTYDYIGLPSYRKIVALGKPALPFLQQKMSEDRGLDFMLAFAAVEISGWDKRDFGGGSEQEFRDKVLQKMRGSP